MVLKHFVKCVALVCIAGLVSACASTGPRDGFAATDEFEPMSRAFHKGNVRLDRNLLRPAAQVYDFVTPTLFKHLIGNGLSHIELPSDFANYVFQGDVDRALETFGRFTMNTIMGAGGLLDPASEFGLPRQQTDFGITLGTHGVGEGSYLVLPLMGPTTTRDTVGFFVDIALSPTAYLGGFSWFDGVGLSLTAADLVHQRDAQFEFVDDVLYESEDSYVTVRSGYLQRRRSQIAGPENTAATLPDLFADEPEIEDDTGTGTEIESEAGTGTETVTE